MLWGFIRSLYKSEWRDTSGTGSQDLRVLWARTPVEVDCWDSSIYRHYWKSNQYRYRIITCRRSWVSSLNQMALFYEDCKYRKINIHNRNNRISHASVLRGLTRSIKVMRHSQILMNPTDSAPLRSSGYRQDLLLWQITAPITGKRPAPCSSGFQPAGSTSRSHFLSLARFFQDYGYWWL